MLKTGTCSWKYDSWTGLVYSPGVKNYLIEYSRKYPTVEIDQWFWSLHGPESVSLPREKDVVGYTESVPDDFRFTIKIPNSITLTHFYSRGKAPLVENPHFLSPELMDAFLKTLDPMKGKLGPLMFQFEYLNKQKMPSQAEFQERFGAFIETIPSGYEYAVEIRNPNYLNKSFFEFLAKQELIPVLIHGYYMPPVYETLAKPFTHSFKKMVIRLHGTDREGIEELTGKKWNQIVLPKNDDLQKVVNAIRILISRETEIYLNVNNHYEGSAPLTIDRINELMREEMNLLPPNESSKNV